MEFLKPLIMARTLDRLARRIALTAVALVLVVPPASGELASESQLKAAYLINFLKYVEWPETGTTINLCLFGRNNLIAHLAVHDGRLIGGRELHIRKVSNAEQIVDCHELFIPASEASHFASVIRWVDKQPILTVSDAETFPAEGGAIAIFRSNGGLRFDINAEALDKAGLHASPLMMRLARKVSGAPR
jgi:hypothetical protein